MQHKFIFMFTFSTQQLKKWCNIFDVSFIFFDLHHHQSESDLKWPLLLTLLCMMESKRNLISFESAHWNQRCAHTFLGPMTKNFGIANAFCAQARADTQKIKVNICSARALAARGAEKLHFWSHASVKWNKRSLGKEKQSTHTHTRADHTPAVFWRSSTFHTDSFALSLPLHDSILGNPLSCVCSPREDENCLKRGMENNFLPALAGFISFLVLSAEHDQI